MDERGKSEYIREGKTQSYGVDDQIKAMFFKLPPEKKMEFLTYFESSAPTRQA